MLDPSHPYNTFLVSLTLPRTAYALCTRTASLLIFITNMVVKKMRAVMMLVVAMMHVVGLTSALFFPFPSFTGPSTPPSSTYSRPDVDVTGAIARAPAAPGVVPVPQGTNRGNSLAWYWAGPAIGPGRTRPDPTPITEVCPKGFVRIPQKVRAKGRRFGGFAFDDRMKINGDTVCCMPPPRNAGFDVINLRPCGVRCRSGYKLINPYEISAQCIRCSNYPQCT